jgi:hypothetical protein
MSEWLLLSPWLDTTYPCSGEADERILVDGGAYGEVRSETG